MCPIWFQVKSELPSTFKAFRFQQHRWSCGPANLFRKMLMEIVTNKVCPNTNSQEFKLTKHSTSDWTWKFMWSRTCCNSACYWLFCRKWRSGRRSMSSTTFSWYARSLHILSPFRSTASSSQQRSLSPRSAYRSGAVSTFPQPLPLWTLLALPGENLLDNLIKPMKHIHPSMILGDQTT
jgi:hypothetical protein